MIDYVKANIICIPVDPVQKRKANFNTSKAATKLRKPSKAAKQQYYCVRHMCFKNNNIAYTPLWSFSL